MIYFYLYQKSSSPKSPPAPISTSSSSTFSSFFSSFFGASAFLSFDVADDPAWADCEEPTFKLPNLDNPALIT